MGSNNHVARALTFPEAQMQNPGAQAPGPVNPYQQFQPQPAAAGYPYAAGPAGQVPVAQYTYIQVTALSCSCLYAQLAKLGGICGPMWAQ